MTRLPGDPIPCLRTTPHRAHWYRWFYEFRDYEIRCPGVEVSGLSLNREGDET